MGIESGGSQALCPAVDDVAAGAWPPGFRFHPTDEELVLYYLKKKICRRRIKLDIIRETDVYKWDPEELPGQSMLKTGDRQWFFFSPRDRKYPNAARSNRATRHGHWKATGKDRNITCNSRSVGVKKTLVFYRGRAPNGERTDWVMHEYTLDEDELSRCKNVQDYYALYKVFKKSGPGPKNGEQYGAPFKEEEEWAEDDYVDVLQSLGQGIAAKPLNEVTCFENSKVDSAMQPSLAELEQFMNRLADEPAPGELQVDNHLCMVPKVVEDEAQSILADSSPREIVFPEPIVFQSSAKQRNAPASFDITQSATSQLQSYEASEVTSAPDNFNHTFDISEEGFLEMDDLIGPEPTSSNNAENVPFEEIDGLGEIDLFLDSTMFFHDMGPIDQGVSHPDVNTLDNDLLNYQLESYMVDQLSYQTQPDDMASQINRSSHPDNMANQLNFQLPPNDMANQFGYALQADDMVNQLSYSLLPNSDVYDQISNQFWMHDQRGEVTLSELNQRALNLPTSGVMHESSHHMPNNVNPGTGSGQQPVATTNRFSSALWSFVESIPTAPASAAESALVNRAFERMSSFSRVRINTTTRNANVDPNRAVPVTRWVAPRNKGLIVFSVIGAICAILWVLTGSVRLWGTCISS